MRLVPLLALLGLTGMSAPVSAQSSPASATLALVGGRVVDGYGGRPIENGVVLIEGGAPIVMINGRTVSEGDLLENDLVVLAIRREEIEFIFRGIVFARRL